MKKVITYGTYDLLHYGHIRLLERAKALGDYLIVGVTSDNYDKTRGKINNHDDLTTRIENVRKTGLADKIIVEEYEGQKIEDIQKYNVDIFTLGSDWEGKFDYLNDYCKVIYLERTRGISSSELRTQKRALRLGIIGDEYSYISKFYNESKFVNGLNVIGIFSKEYKNLDLDIQNNIKLYKDIDKLIDDVDAVYINHNYKENFNLSKKILTLGKSVLCDTPISLNQKNCKTLYSLADKNNCILMAELRTAYSTAYSRLLLLLKAGKIGKILSIQATCTSLKKGNHNSLHNWGAYVLLPIFQILGTKYLDKKIISYLEKNNDGTDSFTKIDFIYKNATATAIMAEGGKSEGELIITGTNGYVYIPAPWWKTDYFEIRYENSNDNKRYFYQLDGEGIRYELVTFIDAIEKKSKTLPISNEVSLEICKIMEDFDKKNDYISLT